MLHRHYDNYNQFYSQHVQNHQFQGFADQDRKFTQLLIWSLVVSFAHQRV